MRRIRPLLPAIAIFCLALFVRVLYNNTVARNYYPLHDSLFYQTIGLDLIKEHCFCLHPYISTVYRAPLWPFIMAGLSLIFGPGDYFARLFLCCIGSGTCVLVYLFARDLFSQRIGIIAGIAAAIYPELYIYDGWLYTESLYIFLLFAICYVLFRIQRARTGKIGLWLWCGASLGLLSLTRLNGILVIGFVIAWAIVMIWLKVLKRRPAITGFVAAALLACVLIAPWTVRNYLVSHSFIPVATGDGTVLLGAYNDQILTNPSYLGTWIDPLKSRPDVAKPYPLFTCTPPCEVARENAYKDAAIQWIKGHLNLMPNLLTLHFINLWQPATNEADLPVDRFPNQRSSQIVLAMMETFPIPIFILAVLGLAVTLWKWRELLFIYAMIALTIGQAIIFYGSARFRAPIEPMLILLAAGALWWLTSRQEGTLRWVIERQRELKSASARKAEQKDETPAVDQPA
jgi:4-amino-4-deoxy-L-arabinose transferase-like glycosyltransferase